MFQAILGKNFTIMLLCDAGKETFLSLCAYALDDITLFWSLMHCLDPQ